jgi:hypothetical protein
MRKERVERIMKTVVPELLKEFTTENYTRTPGVNSGAYGFNLWDRKKSIQGKSFEDRFLENLEVELNKIEDHYPLLERIVVAYNNSLLKD